MKYIFSSLLVVISLLNANAQIEYGGISVVLLRGDTIRTNYISINNGGGFNGPYVQLAHKDRSSRIAIREVSVIEGYDSKLNRYRFFKQVSGQYGVPTLAERTFHSERISAYDFSSYSFGMYGGGGSWRHMYFEKEGGIMQKANYANLKKSLADNVEAMNELKKANNLRIAQYGFYALGTGLLIASLSKFLKAAEQNKPGNLSPPGSPDMGSDPVLPYMIGGAISLYIPYFLNSPKQSYMHKAMQKYR